MVIVMGKNPLHYAANVRLKYAYRLNSVFLLFSSLPQAVCVSEVLLLVDTLLKCLIKQEIKHRMSMWEKLLKSPFSSQKPARPDQIKCFDTFPANRISLMNSQKCLND